MKIKRLPPRPKTAEEKRRSHALIEAGATPAQQIIYACIMRRHIAGKYTGTQDVAKDVGYSRRWVWENMREMCNKGILKRHAKDYYIPENTNIP